MCWLVRKFGLTKKLTNNENIYNKNKMLTTESPVMVADSFTVTEPLVAFATSLIHGTVTPVWNGCLGGR